MRLSYFTLLLVVILAIPAVLPAQSSFPRVTTVEPNTAKAGDVVSAAGENLDKANVAELLLTDNKSDVKVEITEQTAAAVKFKIPASIKAGRFSIVIRTPGSADTPAKEYVQPVRVTIE